MVIFIIVDFILFLGLAFLGAGYYIKSNNCHRYRMLGFALFGIFWVLQVPHFAMIGDIFNAIICLIALPFFLYLSYHEYLSFNWKEEEKSLKWLTGTSFIAGTIYFLIEKIPILSGALIYVVAAQSVWLINAFGFNYSLSSIDYANGMFYKTTYNEVSVTILGGQSSTGAQIQIALACTGIQSMMIFVGAILCVIAASRRKWIAFIATVPVIYVLNLVRNISVIYMIYTLGWSYELAHHQIGKIGSLIALIFLAFLLFKILPEILENIWGLMDLWDREERKESKVLASDAESTESINKNHLKDQMEKEKIAKKSSTGNNRDDD